MRILLVLWLCASQMGAVFAGALPQQKTAAALTPAQRNLVASADQLSKAYARKDYATIVDLTYPELVNAMGGKNTMVSQLTTAMNDMEKNGFHIVSITFGAPTKIYEAGMQLHCLLPQTSISTSKEGTYTSKSSLLAISSDKGKSWTFLDVSQMNKDNIKQLFPDFNPALVFPKLEAPVFVPNKK